MLTPNWKLGSRELNLWPKGHHLHMPSGHSYVASLKYPPAVVPPCQPNCAGRAHHAYRPLAVDEYPSNADEGHLSASVASID